VTALPLDIAMLRAAFPGWLIVADGEAWRATREQADAATAHFDRFAAFGQPELTAHTPGELAVRLAALEYSLGMTPTS
jgi:hypothetical protein